MSHTSLSLARSKAAQYTPHVCHTPCQRGALGLDITLIQSLELEMYRVLRFSLMWHNSMSDV